MTRDGAAAWRQRLCCLQNCMDQVLKRRVAMARTTTPGRREQAERIHSLVPARESALGGPPVVKMRGVQSARTSS